MGFLGASGSWGRSTLSYGPTEVQLRGSRGAAPELPDRGPKAHFKFLAPLLHLDGTVTDQPIGEAEDGGTREQ